MTKKWWKEGIAYQIYVRSFKDANGDGIGDLQGIIEKLDYLKDLGIDLIYLNPINKSPNDDNGYDISDFRDIMDEFGTLEDFDQLLKAVHGNGQRLVLDLVINHSSDEHPWFIESRKSKDNPYRDYYIWHPGKGGKEPNNWGSFFGGSAWQLDEATGEYYLHLFSKKQPDFNWRNEKLQNEMKDMMGYWIDKGVDGFRMDAINHLEKDHSFPDGKVHEGQVYGNFIKYVQNLPEVHGYLKDIRNDALNKREDLVLIGETGGVSYDNAFIYTGIDRGELDMTFHFDMHSVGKGKKDWERRPIDLIEEIKDKFTGWQSREEEDGWCPIFYSNHDTTRTVSRLGNDQEFLKESAKMLATLQLTGRGTPFIYNGDEIGMTNAYEFELEDYRDVAVFNRYKDFVEAGLVRAEDYLKGLHLTSRDNSRTPMQWNDSANAGFSNKEPWIKVNKNYREINVEAQMKDPDSILNYYKEMIQLRKDHPVLVYGNFKELNHEDEELYVYLRILEEEQVLVIINFFDKKPVFKIPEELNGLEPELLISNYDCKEIWEDEIELRPYEVRVYRMV